MTATAPVLPVVGSCESAARSSTEGSSSLNTVVQVTRPDDIFGTHTIPAGTGYRFVAADGGVFAYGAAFYGTPVFASTPAPAPAPGPTSTGIEASFSCNGSVSNGGVFSVEYWTKARPGLPEGEVGEVSLPWSATLALTPTDGYVVLFGGVYPAPGSTTFPSFSGTCTNTVTWPGGSVTQTSDGGYAQVCSDYPSSSAWVACPSGSDN